MTIEYLTQEEFQSVTAGKKKGHWKKGTTRWDYHKAAVELVREIAPGSPGAVLEMGTLGVSIVKGSDTIDYAEKWNFKNKNPTYLHDARILPWPIPDRKYEVFIALRVFQHLRPVQKECFHEACRIARHVIIVAPEAYKVQALEDTSRGIPREEFTQWNGGVAPTRTIEIRPWIGNLYYWNAESMNPSP